MRTEGRRGADEGRLAALAGGQGWWWLDGLGLGFAGRVYMFLTTVCSLLSSCDIMLASLDNNRPGCKGRRRRRGSWAGLRSGRYLVTA